MSKKIKVEEEFAPAEFFGRSDLRFNYLISHLHQEGILEDTTDRAFGDAIGRTAHTVGRWRNYQSFPNSVSLVLIAKTFKVDINWIVGLRGNSLKNAFTEDRTTLSKAV